MKVLVTGGAGYVGSILCEHLLAAGHHVVVIDNLMYGEQNTVHVCANPRFDFVFGDVRDQDVLKPLIGEADRPSPWQRLLAPQPVSVIPWAPAP